MNYNITEEEKHSRNDRIAYIYLMLRNDKTKQFINNKIVELNITSRSTADREISKIDKWNKATKELFLATYIPTESDSKAIEKILGLNASKVSSEVIEEPKNDNERFEVELRDGEIVEHNGKKYKFVYAGKYTSDDCQICDLFYKQITNEESCICSNYGYNVMGYFKQEEDKHTECDTEASHIINELSAKNEELQKELQKYKNDLITVLDDRQKLECLLSDNINNTALNPKYDSLYKVLLAAYYRDWETDRKSTRLNSSHLKLSRMPSSA